ncbi:MAG: serine hydrolase domain-containing protein [Bacteroidales bacterium]
MKKSFLKVTVLCTMALGIGISAKSQSVDDLLNGYYAQNRFMGSVMIVEDGKVIFQKGYGYADIANKVRNDESTIFDLGSVTKTMTAVAIMKLHDEGKISVYDRVDKYIPGFISDSTDKITIINLLNHTSGMSANLGRIDESGKGVIPGTEPVLIDSLIAKFKNSKLKSIPGKKYEYNNYGYTLLAYIIEKVSGMDYPTYLQKEIFTKVVMPNTSYKLNMTKESAIGYNGIGSSNLVPAKDEFHPSWIIGAGYMYSSTVDLAKYIDAVFSGKLFSAKNLKFMMDSCVNIGASKRFWALGWEKRNIAGFDFYSHSGGIFGFSTKIGYIPEKNISIIVLSNLTKEIKFDDIYSAKFSFVDEITESIVKIINGEKVALLPAYSRKPNASVSGKYKFDDSHFATLLIRNDSLFLTTEQKDDFTMFDYVYYREITDTSARYSICKEFAKAILNANFDGFDQYASDEIKVALFNPKGIAQINGGWKYYASKSGDFKSFNICSISENNYSIVFHFEKTEIVMQLSFNSRSLIQGLFFKKVVPKCTVYNVSLIPVGNNEFFIDGYKYGGYNDYRVKFDKNTNALNFKSETEDFTAVKID